MTKSIKDRLSKETMLAHQASALAYDIYLLRIKSESSNVMEIKELEKIYLSNLSKWGLDDILVKQVNYAKRIADSKKQLLYEEMHKLFSLCNEIYALENIGLRYDCALKQQYEKSLHQRFEREKTKAKLVAEDTIETWNKNLWWYRENTN